VEYHNYDRILKMLESINFDERMQAVEEFKEIGAEVVPDLIIIAGDNSIRVEIRKTSIYALGEIGDKRAKQLLLKIIKGFWAGSAEKREENRIDENLSKDEHIGLAREARGALLEMGYKVETSK